jgi:HPt (histidine-containing phosphotransfer) domain-containing protein
MLYNGQDDFTEADPGSETLRKIFENAAIPGLDVQGGIQRLGGDEKSYLDVIRSYAGNTGFSLEKMKTVSRDKLSEYTVYVHGIKGSSQNICAEPVGELAEKLEKAAKAGDYDFVIANNERLIKSTEALITAINHLIGKIDAANQKPQKDKPDKEVLQKLLSACGTYEMNVVYDAIKELESYTYESGGDLVPWLNENVEQFNIEQVIEKVTLFINEKM